ncbi:MAG: dihydropteroate synthase [Candidatus Thermoplasmatota archaeon]|nr:dihydropteroate synthase [Candidatus Thermoplasmatota archaeon]MEC7458379.1 dihydropteroate synthase [Candidatus Thermoplasmatota archaeon]
MADWRPMLKRREDGFPRIMGVVNVTPDSFHARSRSSDINHAVETAMMMASEGADWIDIGGESTRPGASPVTVDDELSRVIPAIEAIRSQLPDVCISIDSRRSEVAIQALNAGADMVNDVSAMSDPEMLSVISEHDCPVCIMHMQGLPENMQDDPRYDDVVREVREYLGKVAGLLIDEGVKPSQIVADPGIGFGKTLEHNIALLSSGRAIVPDERMSLMWGVSRKSMFLDLLGREDSENRLAGTLGVAAISPEKKVDILRVHDVAEHSDSFKAMKAVR